jgi:hypothetical protein
MLRGSVRVTPRDGAGIGSGLERRTLRSGAWARDGVVVPRAGAVLRVLGGADCGTGVRTEDRGLEASPGLPPVVSR